MSCVPVEAVARACRVTAWQGFIRRSAWALDLGREVIIPFTPNGEVGGGVEFNDLDEVVVDVGVDARLQKRVERCPRAVARDVPCLQIHRRRIGELPVAQAWSP